MQTTLLLGALFVTACGDRQVADRSTSDSTGSMPADAPAAPFRQSDTMQIYMHVVKPGRAAEYERWVGDVWMPAIEKAGQRLPDVREMNSRQRMFKLTDKDKDGSRRYVWLFEPAAPASTTAETWVYPDSFLVAGGMSPTDAAAKSKALSAMLTSAPGGEAVRKF